MQSQNINSGAVAQEETGIEACWRLPVDWPIADLCDFHPYLQPVEPACDKLPKPLPCPVCGMPVEWVVRSTRRAVVGYIRLLHRWILETERR